MVSQRSDYKLIKNINCKQNVFSTSALFCQVIIKLVNASAIEDYFDITWTAIILTATTITKLNIILLYF